MINIPSMNSKIEGANFQTKAITIKKSNIDIVVVLLDKDKDNELNHQIFIKSRLIDFQIYKPEYIYLYY